MTMNMEDVMHGLNHRAAADGVIVALGASLHWWIDGLHGIAQAFVFWGTVALVAGRLILLALDMRERLGGALDRLKAFTGERFGRNRSPKP